MYFIIAFVCVSSQFKIQLKYNQTTDGNSIVYKKKYVMGIGELYVLNFSMNICIKLFFVK